MAAKILAGITDRWKSCAFLLTALMEQGAKVAAAQLELVRPHLAEGDVEPDFFCSILGKARRLSASIVALIGEDHTLYSINARWTMLREQLKEGIAALAEAILALRRGVQSRFKKPDLLALGLQSPRDRRSEPLVRQADLIGTAFERDDLDELLGEDRHEGTDPRVPAAQVREAAAALRSTQDELNKIRRRHDEALLKKNELVKEHDELFIYTARSFEADCRLAGFKELAKRVRPSVSRPGRTEEEPDEDGLPPTPEPGQDASTFLSTLPGGELPALEEAVESVETTPAESATE